MTGSFVPRLGGVLSADIAVPEHEREVGFYARVLTTGEDSLWREDLMNKLGGRTGLPPRSALSSYGGASTPRRGAHAPHA